MKRLLSSVVVFVLALISTVPVIAQSLSKGDGDLRVMTYNINEGTDYIEVQAATTADQFGLAVGATIYQVRATDPHGRMKAVAKQIIAAKPALASLQEIDTWFTSTYNPVTHQCGTSTLEFDMLADLMAALNEQGVHYQVSKLKQQWAIPMVPGYIYQTNTFLCVGVIDYIAVLSRTDLPNLVITATDAQDYQHILYFPLPGGGYLPFPRAWISVDATFNGKPFRLINSHLESTNIGDIRRQQGEELRLGPANMSLPVIVAFDSNSQAYPYPQDPTYVDFLSAGFVDVWSARYPNLPGYTSGQDQFLTNPESKLNTRIDLILLQGAIVPQRIALFGDTQDSKTPGGLWPSDHAGVAAQLNVQLDQ
jgi:hypothetical protein